MPLNPRETAFRSVLELETKGTDSGMITDSISRIQFADRRDRALAVHIFLGTVRYRRLLDAVIGRYSNIIPEKLDRKVRILLQTALYQMLFLDRIPDHALVDETVRLSHKHCPRAVSFVNAVLRKAAADPERDVWFTDPSALSMDVRCSVDKGLADRLCEAYGDAFTEEFLDWSEPVPGITLQVNLLKIRFEDYLRLLDETGVEYEINTEGRAATVESCPVRELPGYEEGFFFVQDPAAAACSEIAGIRPGMAVLDACAAPGGKSFSAAIAMEGQGTILARDINLRRIVRIRENAERLGIDILTCSAADARIYDPELDAQFDVVLADVPCSGFGVITKKPEIRYKKPDDVKKLPLIQLAILDNLSRYVQPGGTLLYSTCTVLPEENELVVCRFLEEHPDFQTQDFLIRGFSSDNGMFTFWPHLHRTDGFFVAKLRRTDP